MTASPEAGDLVVGRYELGEVVGEGGFAKVFGATDVQTGERVALKYPNYEGSQNDRDIVTLYFEKEAETLEAIAEAGGHPSIMSLVEVTEDRGTPVVVVELVDGYELDDAIRRTGPLDDIDEVRQIGIDLCDAMSFLHENEIVYRDLKPDNVMITHRGGTVTPVLIDFNTATGFDAGGNSADQTTIVGPYKPREVAEADQTEMRQGPWSDVYSVGKILLYLLKGTVPRKDGVDPRDFGADCEPYLAEIVEKATQTDYEDRYRNATAMKRVLEDRDPSPPPSATVRYTQAGETYTVYPGDTIGRRYAEGPRSSIVVEDDDEYISTVQVQFDTDADGEWFIRDRSLNGTYVQTGGGWQRVLSEAGRERLEERGEDATDRNGEVPPELYGLREGDLIALVHPSYGVTFEFGTD
ncbi:serine/threonine protein kinase [Halosimplex salinum]|uniref:serine/threonine protein kinase n=1 Tax=Halosimplex salinum TaxID=1710538 RepID=UPI000F4797D9|nr:protein kinase [Halosimplex salinum]